MGKVEEIYEVDFSLIKVDGKWRVEVWVDTDFIYDYEVANTKELQVSITEFFDGFFSGRDD